jgi:hypothetical protein
VQKGGLFPDLEAAVPADQPCSVVAVQSRLDSLVCLVALANDVAQWRSAVTLWRVALLCGVDRMSSSAALSECLRASYDFR